MSSATSRTLPLLPGISPSPVGSGRHHKRQNLSFANGVAVVVGDSAASSSSPRRQVKVGAQPQDPAWLVFDKQTLCFDCYFQEAVHERRDEHFRVRMCKLYFFPEDDTLEIIEPQKPNSGLPQGKILRRHRVPKPAPNDDEHYEPEDFNIGKEVTVYGRTYLIINCDPFTRNFLTKLGISVSEPIPPPSDPHTELTTQRKAAEIALRPYHRQDKLGQFLKHDREVLRFYCLWDDTSSECGDKRYMVLHYFLADDTIEIREIQAPNSGRDGPAVFLKRQRLPKGPEEAKVPGSVTDRTMLNVFGKTGLHGRHIMDNLQTDTGRGEMYSAADLEIGVTVNVYGRGMLICDMDEFTQNYYRSHYGIQDFTPLSVDDEEEEGSATQAPQQSLPTYSGFGTEEDSMVSVHHLVLKPPKKDFAKWFKAGQNTLQFKARLDTDSHIDAEREFAVVFYLADDTIAVFEERKRNSGIAGGKFIERTKLKVADKSRPYAPSDFTLGAVVDLNAHRFVLTDASEFSLDFLQNYTDCAEANVDTVCSKAQHFLADATDSIMGAFYAADPADTGMISMTKFEETLMTYNSDLSLHELRTLARTFGGATYKTAGVNYKQFATVALQVGAEPQAE
eukprot:m.95331 g.95331  ORF g.95331 m.95331 type:complete len:620 (+) comp13056_c0_seq1:128-1987(+)